MRKCGGFVHVSLSDRAVCRGRDPSYRCILSFPWLNERVQVDMVDIIATAETIEQVNVRILLVGVCLYIMVSSSLGVGRRLLGWLMVNIRQLAKQHFLSSSWSLLWRFVLLVWVGGQLPCWRRLLHIRSPLGDHNGNDLGRGLKLLGCEVCGVRRCSLLHL